MATEDTELVSVSITAGNADWLAGFVRSLVDDKLAACGNIYPIRSIYRWEGKTEDDAETIVVLHTRRGRVAEIIERADREHDYDTPQVLAVPILEAHPGYAQWVLDSTEE
jgi:periplasmic divalent cation tolerance protein